MLQVRSTMLHRGVSWFAVSVKLCSNCTVLQQAELPSDGFVIMMCMLMSWISGSIPAGSRGG